MKVTIAEAKNRLPKLTRAVERGERVVITRRGKPVAQLNPAPAARRRVVFGGMKDRVKLLPGWDDPIEEWGGQFCPQPPFQAAPCVEIAG